MSQCGAVLLAEARAYLLYISEEVTWARSSDNRLAAAAPKLPSSLMWSAPSEVRKMDGFPVQRQSPSWKKK